MYSKREQDLLKLKVWMKGNIILNHDPAVFRKDDFGNIIEFTKYGDRNAQYGWEIDHIVPSALGGPDSIENLRPLHWRQNVGMGNALQKRLENSPRNSLLNLLKG